uniref:Uncharacterized protein n=1 Tax=Solanum lycopersicum TaxID=4081 RepID=A0A3Q7GST5_SOLLC
MVQLPIEAILQIAGVEVIVASVENQLQIEVMYGINIVFDALILDSVDTEFDLISLPESTFMLKLTSCDSTYLLPFNTFTWCISKVTAKIPRIILVINKSIYELEFEMDHFGRPIYVDARAQLYTIVELCRVFDKIFKELDKG